MSIIVIVILTSATLSFPASVNSLKIFQSLLYQNLTRSKFEFFLLKVDKDNLTRSSIIMKFYLSFGISLFGALKYLLSKEGNLKATKLDNRYLTNYVASKAELMVRSFWLEKKVY